MGDHCCTSKLIVLRWRTGKFPRWRYEESSAAGGLLSTSALHDGKSLVYEFIELIAHEPG